jgi:dTDP-4-dehydrorhamnose reductase
MLTSKHKPMRFYILGANGFLGSSCATYLREKGHDVLTRRIDVNDFSALQSQFSKAKPDVVINLTGAKAYPTIDWCEDHKVETVQINVAGAINVMLAGLECGAYPIQITSGCIYSGGPEHEFTEEDTPNFHGSFYSRMRVVLQDALAELPVLQARIRMPVSQYSHPRNFINKIVSYPKIISIPNSVTLIEDLYPALERLARIRPVGILNLTNKGYIAHGDILEKYKQIVNPKHVYELITLNQLEGPGGITKARRSNCVLSSKKAEALGIQMSILDDAQLEEIMKKFKQSLLAK